MKWSSPISFKVWSIGYVYWNKLFPWKSQKPMWWFRDFFHFSKKISFGKSCLFYHLYSFGSIIFVFGWNAWNCGVLLFILLTNCLYCRSFDNSFFMNWVFKIPLTLDKWILYDFINLTITTCCNRNGNSTN